MTVTEEHEEIDQILSGLTDFVEAVVIPLEKANAELLENHRLLYDERGAYSAEARALTRQVRMESAKAGFYSMFAPVSIGGEGCGARVLYRCWKHLYETYGAGRLLPFATLAHWSYGPSVLFAHLTEEQSAQVLESIMTGEESSCFAMSEPDAGSDAWAMRTRAVEVEDGWVLSGTKQWITGSPTAGWVFVWAVTNPELRDKRRGGISCFLLPMDAPGVKLDSVIKLFGSVGGDEGIVSFDEVRVPRHALVGELDRGFELAMKGISTGRLYNAARCVGLARWALNRAATYADQRSTFGRTISQYQGISFQLADSAVELYAADAISRDCAERHDRGDKHDVELAMVKLYTTEMCSRVLDRCMQVHGGMGLTNEMKLYDAWHQARIVRIADGSAEIMRRNIAKSLSTR